MRAGHKALVVNPGTSRIQLCVHAVHDELLDVVDFQQLHNLPPESSAQNWRRPSESGAAATCFAWKAGALGVQVFVHAVHEALLDVVDFQQLQIAPVVSTAQNWRRPSESGAAATQVAVKAGAPGVQVFVHAVHEALLDVVDFQQLQMAPAVSTAQNCRRPSESGAAATCFAWKVGGLGVQLFVHDVHAALADVVDFQQLQIAPSESTAQNCSRLSDSGATARFVAANVGSAGVH
jgi:membrane protease subunit (stomatin/prohibitin family)